jgi:tRNA-Thr(GGU) m(6)t(6)A37 methyltransferase TsaA
VSPSIRDLVDRVRRGKGRPRGPAEVTLHAIGWVENRVTQPRPNGWEGIESRIVIEEEHRARLRGIERYSHLIVVYYMDIAAEAPHFPEELTLPSGNVYGIFATRSQLRPNHLGVSVVPLLRVEGGVLRVRGLDAIDGTPVLDLKPYLPEYDAVPEARIPGADDGSPPPAGPPDS